MGAGAEVTVRDGHPHAPAAVSKHINSHNAPQDRMSFQKRTDSWKPRRWVNGALAAGAAALAIRRSLHHGASAWTPPRLQAVKSHCGPADMRCPWPAWTG
jgi:hypothetical protein